MIAKPALIMLASGLSQRFGNQNKLLANLNGRPMAMHTAELWLEKSDCIRIAVVPPLSSLSNLYERTDWRVVENSNPSSGQTSSIRAGLSAAIAEGANRTIICLADMPFVEEEHVQKIDQSLNEHEAVMSIYENTLMPPAGFSRSVFDEVIALKGNKGAKSVFLKVKTTTTLPISSRQARDIDTKEDLRQIELRESVA